MKPEVKHNINPDETCAGCGHAFRRHGYDGCCLEKVEMQGHLLTFSATETFSRGPFILKTEKFD